MHYLEKELQNLIQTDPSFWTFLQQGSLDGVWYWDLEQPDNEWMSPEFWQLFGVDPATKTHDPSEWQDIIDPMDLEVALENFDKHCKDPSHPYDQIVRYRHADGSTVWVRCRGMAIRDENGVAIRMLGAHNDLTQLQVQAEVVRTQIQQKSALTRKNKVVENINEELRAFAYAVSHELKSPTNSTQLLLDEVINHSDAKFGPESEKLMELANETLSGMRDLIEELLRYTRVIGQELNFKRVDLTELTQKVLAEMVPEIEEALARVSVGELPTILGHEVQLHSLLSNLIGNAIKYRHPDRPCEINIDCHPHENTSMILLNVSDNGVGIAPQSRTSVFGMFNRLHHKSEEPGIGLGLALCKRIAVNHGGDVFVSTPEDHDGTVICATLAKIPS